MLSKLFIAALIPIAIGSFAEAKAGDEKSAIAWLESLKPLDAMAKRSDDPALLIAIQERQAVKSLLARQERARLERQAAEQYYSAVSLKTATVGASIAAALNKKSPLAFGVSLGTTIVSSYLSDRGRAAAEALEKLQDDQFQKSMNEYVQGHLKSMSISLADLPADQKKSKILEIFEDTTHLQQQFQSPEVGDYFQTMKVELIERLMNKDADWLSKQIVDRASGSTISDDQIAQQIEKGANYVADLKISLLDNMGPLVDYASVATEQLDPKAHLSFDETIDVTSQFAKKAAPALLGLKNIGADPEMVQAAADGVSKLDSALSVVGGIAALYAGQPGGAMMVLQGIGGLGGTSDKQESQIMSFITQTNIKLDKISRQIDDVRQKQKIILQQLQTIQDFTAARFNLLEDQIGELRTDIETVGEHSAFRPSLACFRIEAAMNIESEDAAAERAIAIATKNNDDVVSCMRFLEDLFADENSQQVFDPLSLGLGRLSPTGKYREWLAALTNDAIRQQMDGSINKQLSTESIKNYLGLARFRFGPLQLASTWNEARQDLIQIGITKTADPPRDTGPDPKLLLAFSSLALRIAPFYWMLSLHDGILRPAISRDSAMEQRGQGVLTALHRRLLEALAATSIGSSSAGEPFLLAWHQAEIDRFLRARNKLIELKKRPEAPDFPNQEAFQLAQAEYNDALLAKTASQRQVFILEGAIAAQNLQADFTAQAIFEQMLKRSASPTIARIETNMTSKLLRDLPKENAFTSREADNVYWASLRGTVFAWQEGRNDDTEREALSELYNPKACYAENSTSELISAWNAWPAERREAMQKFCSKLAAMMSELNHEASIHSIRRYAWFAGEKVELPEAYDNPESIKAEGLDLLANYEQVQSLRDFARASVKVSAGNLIFNFGSELDPLN